MNSRILKLGVVLQFVAATGLLAATPGGIVSPNINVPPRGTVGTPYTFQVLSTNSPAYYRILSGGLPPGLLMSEGGAISGTPTTAGTWYPVISGFFANGTRASGEATFAISISGPVPTVPNIVTQPQDVTTRVDLAASFAVVASGTDLRYQWRKDGAPIAGATSATLRFAAVRTADEGTYVVSVSNSAGSATSRAAKLTVTLDGAGPVLPMAPVIVAQPVGRTVVAGESITFSVTTSAPPAVTYQWRFNGAPISGATQASFTLSAARLVDSGAYSVVVANANGSTTSSAATLIVKDSRIVNLSILTSLERAGDTLTLGFVAGGEGTVGRLPVLVRAAGPSLRAFDVAQVLSDPGIDIFAGSSRIAGNDNWATPPGGDPATVAQLTSLMSRVGAFAFADPDSHDAAVVADVALGGNSIEISGRGTAPNGAVLAEIYDATEAEAVTAATPRLVNVSVLQDIGSRLVAGFVIAGPRAKTVLLRAVGPTLGLAPFNVPDIAADPAIALFSGSTRIEANDDWGGTARLTAAFAEIGAFALPPNSRDAAVIVALQPDSYTVHVTASGGSGGRALLEIYELP